MSTMLDRHLDFGSPTLSFTFGSAELQNEHGQHVPDTAYAFPCCVLTDLPSYTCTFLLPFATKSAFSLRGYFLLLPPLLVATPYLPTTYTVCIL